MTAQTVKCRYVVTEVGSMFEAGLSAICTFCRTSITGEIRSITETIQVMLDSPDLLVVQASWEQWPGQTFTWKAYVTVVGETYFVDLIEV